MTHFNKRLIRVGAVVFIASGKDHGKVAVVVDILSMKRLIIDGPGLGVERQVISTRDVRFVNIFVSIPRGILTAALSKMVEKAEIKKKWEATNWFKMLEKSRKTRQMGDFDRFKKMVEKRRTAFKVNQALSKSRAKATS